MLEGFVARCGLLGRLIASGVILTIGGFGLVSVLGQLGELDTRTGWLLLGFALALMAAGVAFGLIAVRCPRCHTGLVLRAWRTQRASLWLSWLLALDCCPKCGTRGP
jgi:hypothetical protein